MIVAMMLAASACGVERRAVKTACDPGLAPVIAQAKHSVTAATVEQLIAFVPPVYLDTNPRSGPELIVYAVRAQITGYKLEADGDFHIVIRGASGATMVVESPNPSCAVGSLLGEEISNARAQATRVLPSKPTPKFVRLKVPICVDLSGLGFFDKIHGQVGVAVNGIELHPVLSVAAARGCRAARLKMLKWNWERK